ncbi:hypothetical protein ABZ352_35515 [Streptomyces griseofuscus]|uniref:hypothetical protein n=1 Tax=Streptomyces griseofuscus TaxID=146922 RepID=UPI0033ECDBAE
MSMADLVSAGAPELPEGWFYRVKRAYPYRLGFKLEIRQQHRIGSELMADAFVLEERHDDMTEAVVRACRCAHRKVQARAEAGAKLAALEMCLGDHDPKGGR